MTFRKYLIASVAAALVAGLLGLVWPRGTHAPAIEPTPPSVTDDARYAGLLEAQAGELEDVDRAVSLWNRALAMRDKLGDPAMRAANRIGLATTLFAAGRTDDARESLVASMKVLDAAPLTASTAPIAFNTLTMLARIENAGKRWTDAEEHARRAIALAERPLAPQLVHETDYSDLGAALLGKGDRPAAEAAFAKAIELAGVDPHTVANTQMMIALAYHAQHDEKHAIEHAEHAADVAAAQDLTEKLEFELTLCKILLADGQRARTLPLAEKLVPRLEDDRRADPIAVGDARFVLARALPDTQRARARKLAEDAKAALTKGGAIGTTHAADIDAWLASEASR
jgi:tetratricopeptide (TPR) repeat protein